MAQRLGEGVVVRSDDVVGNEVHGAAWLADGEEQRYVAVFSDDGEILDCRFPLGGSTGEGGNES